MIHKKVAQVGGNGIRAKAKAVSKPTSAQTKKVVTDLIDSMRFHDLVGMAAPQIGKDARIFVTEIRITKSRKSRGIKKDALRVFINPKITSFSKSSVSGWEGCGSVAESGLFGRVKRPSSVSVTALNEKGEPFSLTARGLLARIIQHEVDHLNGIVFTDKGMPSSYMSRSEYLKLRKT